MASTWRRMRLALASVSFAAASLAHAAGTLDPTFVNGPTPVSGINYPSIAVSPDGRIAIAGTRLTADGTSLIPYGKVAVFDDAGHLHASFGTAGVVGLAPPAEPAIHSADAVTFDALGRVLASGARLSSVHGAFSLRLRADGHQSATYANGSPGTSPPSRMGGAFTLAIDRKSRILLGGTTAFHGRGLYLGPSTPSSAVLMRLRPDGSPDASFGDGGQVVFAHPGIVRAIVEDERNGLTVVSGSSNLLVAMRLSESGTIDTGFGVGGQTGMRNTLAAAGDGQGRMLGVIANEEWPFGTRLVRLANGILDESFAAGGELLLTGDTFNSIAVARDGSVYIGTADRGGTRATLRILRVRNDGVIDLGYGYRGEAAVSFDYEAGGGSDFPTLAVDPEGRLVVAVVRYGAQPPAGTADTTLMLYRFTSGSTPPPGTATAVEYRHAGFDHYFVTASPEEIARLDDGSSGWARTGESFTVQTRANGTALPVCRFFSGDAFAPQSSHFYTPYADECDTVEAGPAWQFEKLAFFLTMPTGAGHGNGTCPSGTVPLYRAFNAMKGGAPNHRYTTRASTLDAMIAQGWIMEGEAITRVFACVPL